MHTLMLLPALCLAVQNTEWTSWEALARDEANAVVVSSRIRGSAPSPQGEAEWVLNLRNDTEKTLSLSYRWEMAGQSHTGSLKLEPSRIQEVTRSFPRGQAGARPSLTLLEWHFGE